MKAKEVLYHPYTAFFFIIVLLWMGLGVHTMPELDPANCVEPHPIFYVPCIILLILIAGYSPSLPKRMDQQ